MVGEAPGEDEDEEGRPFVGKAGKILREALDTLGLDLDKDAWTTNALICRPPNNVIDDDRKITYCRPNLLNALSVFEPVVVIPLGRMALTSVIGLRWARVDAMSRWTGWKIPFGKFWVCPTYHPSYLLRSHNPRMNRLFEQDLRRAFALTKPPKPLPEFTSQVELLFEEREIFEALRDIDREGGWVAVDYETNCLKPEYPKAKVLSFSVSNGKRTIAYPWFGDAIAATGLFLRSDRTRKIASNLKFEERWTRKVFGYPVANWGWDTMLAAHVLDNREGICSLKFQMFVRCGVVYNTKVDEYLSVSEDGYNIANQEIDIKDLLLYNGLDSLFEVMLARLQRKEMGYGD